MPSPTPSTSVDSTCSWCRPGALASAPRSRWSTCGIPASRWSCCIVCRPDQVSPILDGLTGKAFPQALVLCKIEQWDHITAQLDYGSGLPDISAWNEVPFFKGQKKIVLRNCGLINPDDIEEYIADRRLPVAVQGAASTARRRR